MLKSYFKSPEEAGTDEAGRGCLAGPVTAAAVMLPIDFKNSLLNDSKQLSEKNRAILKPIIEKEALAWGVVHLGPETIDKINILNASIRAMHLALDNLSLTPSNIIVDGNRFKTYKAIQHYCIVKGDSKFLSIAAASILAKTARDTYMEQLHKEYPMYNWKQNKGYPTKEHRKAIARYGVTEYHRKSFKLLPDQLKLDL